MATFFTAAIISGRGAAPGKGDNPARFSIARLALSATCAGIRCTAEGSRRESGVSASGGSPTPQLATPPIDVEHGTHQQGQDRLGLHPVISDRPQREIHTDPSASCRSIRLSDGRDTGESSEGTPAATLGSAIGERSRVARPCRGRGTAPRGPRRPFTAARVEQVSRPPRMRRSPAAE